MSGWELSKQDLQEGRTGLAVLSSRDPCCPKASVSTTANVCQTPRLDVLNKVNDLLYQSLCDIWKRSPIHETPGELCFTGQKLRQEVTKASVSLAKKHKNNWHSHCSFSSKTSIGRILFDLRHSAFFLNTKNFHLFSVLDFPIFH